MQEDNGARACVEAKYEVRSSRRIALTFQAAGVSARSTCVEATIGKGVLLPHGANVLTDTRACVLR